MSVLRSSERPPWAVLGVAVAALTVTVGSYAVAGGVLHNVEVRSDPTGVVGSGADQRQRVDFSLRDFEKASISNVSLRVTRTIDGIQVDSPIVSASNGCHLSGTEAKVNYVPSWPFHAHCTIEYPTGGKHGSAAVKMASWGVPVRPLNLIFGRSTTSWTDGAGPQLSGQ